MDYLIADPHYGHEKILKYELMRSAFKSVEDMNEALIDNWNSVVNKYDRVFVLGDLCWGTKNIHYASRLKGIKYLIGGNHDNAPTMKYLEHFHKVVGCMSYKGGILTHIPVQEEQFHRFTFNMHGHLHSSELIDIRYINVSCEHHDFKPKTFDQLIERQVERAAISYRASPKWGIAN